MPDKPIIFIAGATGFFGSKIVESALNQGLPVRALVRNPNPKHPAKLVVLQDWQARGAELVQGDVLDADSLKAGIEGAHVVISAVGNVEQILDLGQKNLIYASKAAGVDRFVPSDYSVDYFKADLGDNYNLDYRITTFSFLKDSGVPWTSVLNGAFTEVQFTEFVGLWNPSEGTFNYWGDGETLCDFTLTDDAAAYTIAAALDPEMRNRVCRVAGEVLSMKQVHQAIEEATGRSIGSKSLGSVDELAAWIAAQKKSARSHFEYLGPQYHWLMVSGKGKLEPLDNQRYPQIKPTSVLEYLRLALK